MVALSGRDAERTAMVFDELIGDCETKPGAFALGLSREEGFHDAGRSIRADSRAIVGDNEGNTLLLCYYAEIDVSSWLAGVARIEQQIDQDLLHQARLTADFREIGVGETRQMHTRLPEPMLHQFQSNLPQRRWVDARHARRIASRKRQEPADNVADTF